MREKMLDWMGYLKEVGGEWRRWRDYNFVGREWWGGDWMEGVMEELGKG